MRPNKKMGDTTFLPFEGGEWLARKLGAKWIAGSYDTKVASWSVAAIFDLECYVNNHAGIGGPRIKPLCLYFVEINKCSLASGETFLRNFPLVISNKDIDCCCYRNRCCENKFSNYLSEAPITIGAWGIWHGLDDFLNKSAMNAECASSVYGSDGASATRYGRTENVRVFPIIMPELKLSNVQRHVFAARLVEGGGRRATNAVVLP